MVAPLIGIAVLAIGALVLLPRLGLPLNRNDQERKVRDQQKADEREQKGAIANTIDFFWGNGAAQRTFGSNTKGGGNSAKAVSPARGNAPAATRHYRRRGRIA